MELIEWTDDLSIGHVEIDEQHKEWINIINRLNRALLDNKGNASLDSLFKSVLYYTNYHFTHEENLMQEASYPDFDQHRKLHTYFKEGILAHIQALQAGGQKDVTLVMDSLKDWLIKHIQEEDSKLKKVLS